VLKPSGARGDLQCYTGGTTVQVYSVHTVFKTEGQKCSEMVHVEKQTSPLFLALYLINK
jgi:hypothetical protein